MFKPRTIGLAIALVVSWPPPPPPPPARHRRPSRTLTRRSAGPSRRTTGARCPARHSRRPDPIRKKAAARRASPTRGTAPRRRASGTSMAISMGRNFGLPLGHALQVAQPTAGVQLAHGHPVLHGLRALDVRSDAEPERLHLLRRRSVVRDGALGRHPADVLADGPMDRVWLVGVPLRPGGRLRRAPGQHHWRGHGPLQRPELVLPRLAAVGRPARRDLPVLRGERDQSRSPSGSAPRPLTLASRTRPGRGVGDQEPHDVTVRARQ